MIHIAVVEDNEDLRDEVVFHLGRMGHCVTGLPDGTALDRHLASQPADVLVLDLGLPGEDGVSIARRLAVSHPRLAIAMLTARGQLEDRLVGLESGADIYLVKPVDMRELSAVCESLYRRLHRVDVPERPAEGWQLDMQSLELVPPGGAATARSPARWASTNRSASARPTRQAGGPRAAHAPATAARRRRTARSPGCPG